jgi:peptidyl-tRNA hydrolase
MALSSGKIAAQCSHATLACYKYLLNHTPSASLLQRWERGGQPKIAVQVKSEDELTLLQAQAMSLGLCAKVIHDAGRTQIAAGSATDKVRQCIVYFKLHNLGLKVLHSGRNQRLILSPEYPRLPSRLPRMEQTGPLRANSNSRSRRGELGGLARQIDPRYLSCMDCKTST